MRELSVIRALKPVLRLLGIKPIYSKMIAARAVPSSGGVTVVCRTTIKPIKNRILILYR